MTCCQSIRRQLRNHEPTSAVTHANTGTDIVSHIAIPLSVDPCVRITQATPSSPINTIARLIDFASCLLGEQALSLSGESPNELFANAQNRAYRVDEMPPCPRDTSGALIRNPCALYRLAILPPFTG